MAIIEINGKKIEAAAGSMIIEAADDLGVQIPRFCYHKKLSIAANCRMCLVEVEKAPKVLPACATPITDGMKVWTHSPKALLAQKAVMEFLLINHPLDCPICDQGGECELQDISMGYGNDHSRYTFGKRSIKDQDIGPLIATDMTRCIQCTRCVRFGSEVAGIRELGATGRGEHLEIGTFIERSVDSEVSGNVIDLCPVGALTSKPYRFTARGWELTQHPSIAPHDCVGSNIFIHTRRDKVMRVVPKENESINEVWISDRDRFSYEGIHSDERLKHPKIKQDGRWRDASWQEALEVVSQGFLDIITDRGANDIGALISPNSTLEEMYLLQKWVRGLGSQNIDHRLRQIDFRHQDSLPSFPNLGIPISEIETQNLTLLVGSNLRKEQPLLALKLRKSVLSNGKVVVVNPIDFDFNFEIEHKIIPPGGDLVSGLARIAKAVLDKVGPAQGPIPTISVIPTDADIKIAEKFIKEEKSLVLLGSLALSHPAASQLIALANLIAQLTKAKLGLLTDGANTAGAWLTGCIPHRLLSGEKNPQSGLGLEQMLENPLSGYLLFNFEPAMDCAESKKLLKKLALAKQVVAVTPFESEDLKRVATVLLPMATFAETAGTFINGEGRWQSFKMAKYPLEESRPGWKILRVLGNLCHLTGFEYESAESVLNEIKTFVKSTEMERWDWYPHTEKLVLESKKQLVRISPISLYSADGLVRRALPLQKTKDAGEEVVFLNKAMVEKYGLKGESLQLTCQGKNCVLPWMVDERVPDFCILLTAVEEELATLSRPYETVEIQNV